MAHGSVDQLLVCKEAEAVNFNKSVSANSRGTVTASAAGYVIPEEHVGIIAGYTGETTASTNNTVLFNFISPRAVTTNNFFGARNNSSGTNYTRHISIKMTFAKNKYVDDRRS